ncbi:MAG TPA: Gfo/Idh/MocA family oxidoreductase [Bryobacteraceae bacterium]|nr:Gfo/Idh/MocA family oxidoreductase [Bryobacteraceae bacterium]
MDKVNRRSFLAAGAAFAGNAFSYTRIKGANDRISLGHIGIGQRGRGLAWIASRLKDSQNVEMTAVCDLWSVNREKAAARAQEAYGRAPRAFQYMEELLALQDVDAVILSTGDFQHAPILKTVVAAGKDAYCEKPFANVLEEAKAARDEVLARKAIVQIGTQHRSEPYQIAVHDLIRTGVLGEVSKYEIVWNYHGPRWRGRPEVKQIREADTDWKRWLLTKPYRPFDPQLYFEFRLYKDFSGGIADQWLSHGIDLCHYFLDDHYPRSVMASGGVFAWKDGRENPDTFQTLLEYPKGFLVSYSTSFGNDSDSFTRIMGKQATLINIGGEGSQRWKIVEEKGNHEDNPYIQRAERYVTLPDNDKLAPTYISDNVPFHMANWLECLRSRKQPNATVHNGFAHAVVCIMAARAYREGKKLYWDPKTESILDHAPAEV